jgi:cytochrome c553
MQRWFWILGLILLMAGCSQTEIDFASLPAGNAEAGAALFDQAIKGAPTCVSCHMLTDEILVGPGFAGLSERAATRIDTQSAEEYIFNSILHPSRYIVEGYSNLMYSEYGSRLSAQQVADLIAYLLTP